MTFPSTAPPVSTGYDEYSTAVGDAIWEQALARFDGTEHGTYFLILHLDCSAIDENGDLLTAHKIRVRVQRANDWKHSNARVERWDGHAWQTMQVYMVEQLEQPVMRVAGVVNGPSRADFHAAMLTDARRLLDEAAWTLDVQSPTIPLG
jgi:hypothetical protein